MHIASALMLTREKRLWRHEGLKARSFVCIVIAGMVRALPNHHAAHSSSRMDLSIRWHAAPY